jgi:hypothetical protein
MRALFCLVFPLLLIGANLAPEGLCAQNHSQTNSADRIFLEIDKAEQRGEITREAALIEKYRSLFNPDAMQLQIRVDEQRLIKCLLPLEIEYRKLKNEHQLSAAAISEIDSYSGFPHTDHEQSYLSDSGNFIFYYETVGPNAVPPDDQNANGIPDYVEKAAFAADSSYSFQIDQAGFVDFLKQDPYEIYFENFNFYGTTNSSGSTSFIRIHNNFDGFPPNSHPEGDQIGALFATIAHEIKHAIQYETNRWDGMREASTGLRWTPL